MWCFNVSVVVFHSLWYSTTCVKLCALLQQWNLIVGTEMFSGRCSCLFFVVKQMTSHFIHLEELHFGEGLNIVDDDDSDDYAHDAIDIDIIQYIFKNCTKLKTND